MGSHRHRQRDLFDERTVMPDLRPDLQATLNSLLQALLTEAAGIGPQAASVHSDDQEDGDDQDHA